MITSILIRQRSIPSSTIGKLQLLLILLPIFLWWTSLPPQTYHELRLPWWFACLNQTDSLIQIKPIPHYFQNFEQGAKLMIFRFSSCELHLYLENKSFTTYMMSNTSTIKCRSIMTSKLVRLPDTRFGECFMLRFYVMGLMDADWVSRAAIEITTEVVRSAYRYFAHSLFCSTRHCGSCHCLWCNTSMLMLKALVPDAEKISDFSSFNWSFYYCSKLLDTTVLEHRANSIQV
jgi:hypothetical protein